MDKTKIDWCDSTWNPVTGCLHGCEYCYARRKAERFRGLEPSENGAWNTIQYGKGKERLGVLNSAQVKKCKDGKIIRAPYPFGFTPTLYRYRLNDYINKKGRNIFVCSMADLFGDWVPDEWIEEVFAACAKAPQHNYLFLTKNPKRYLDLEISGKLPKNDNMWYGVTITNMKQVEQAYEAVERLPIRVNLFFSIEPLLEDISWHPRWSDMAMNWWMDWVIIGAETGCRKNKVVPERKWIKNLVNDCGFMQVSVFMKSSLKDIWGEPLIQEFPKKLKGGQQLCAKD